MGTSQLSAREIYGIFNEICARDEIRRDTRQEGIHRIPLRPEEGHCATSIPTPALSSFSRKKIWDRLVPQRDDLARFNESERCVRDVSIEHERTVAHAPPVIEIVISVLHDKSARCVDQDSRGRSTLLSPIHVVRRPPWSSPTLGCPAVAWMGRATPLWTALLNDGSCEGVIQQRSGLQGLPRWQNWFHYLSGLLRWGGGIRIPLITLAFHSNQSNRSTQILFSLSLLLHGGRIKTRQTQHSPPS